MQTWSFFGRVLPERIPLKIADPLSGSSIVEVLDLAFDWSIGVADSQVVATCTVTRGEPDLPTLRNLIEAEIRSLADLIGYLHAVRFDVDIVSAIRHETGERCVFGTSIPAIAQRRKLDDYGKLQTDLLVAIAGEPHARAALADFREAMRVPVGTGFFCYRAVEAMMQSMKLRADEKDRVAWERLRTTLQIDRSALEYLKGHADYPRHGRVGAISDSQRAHVFRISDEVIHRYLEYLQRGKQELAKTEFPLLGGPGTD
jgi:hypothetical protein